MQTNVIKQLLIRFNSLKCPNSYFQDFCQTSDLGLRLEVDFVFHLSQEQQQEQQEQQPLTKIYRIE